MEVMKITHHIKEPVCRDEKKDENNRKKLSVAQSYFLSFNFGHNTVLKSKGKLIKKRTTFKCKIPNLP